MTSPVVRTTYRDTLQAAFPDVLYVETISTRVDNPALPPMWMSLEFFAGNTVPMCIGKPALYRETGTVRVWVCGTAGEGDSDAVDKAAEIASFYRGWADNTLRSQTVSSPANGPESDGRWFMVYVDINYQYDFYQ